MTGEDGGVLRYAKKRQPGEYLSASPDRFTAAQHSVEPGDMVGEFMLNALRLNAGFSRELFTARTGLDVAVIEARLRQLQERGLLISDDRGVRASPLGRRFLDNVVAVFFPD